MPRIINRYENGREGHTPITTQPEPPATRPDPDCPCEPVMTTQQPSGWIIVEHDELP